MQQSKNQTIIIFKIWILNIAFSQHIQMSSVLESVKETKKQVLVTRCQSRFCVISQEIMESKHYIPPTPLLKFMSLKIKCLIQRSCISKLIRRKTVVYQQCKHNANFIKYYTLWKHTQLQMFHSNLKSIKDHLYLNICSQDCHKCFSDGFSQQ